MARGLATLWVLLYTAGLTGPQKARRRGEVASDMYEQIAFTLARGSGSAATAGSIASRTARGMLSDVLWRLEEGREAERAVQVGSEPPLPWFTMWFVGGIIVAGCVASTQVALLGDGRVILAFLAAAGAGLVWLGLYLATHRILAPVCIATGTLCIVCGSWWTVIVPIMAVVCGIAGLRRAQRIETLLGSP